jgi:uncharacterized protein (TIGR01244 family)
MTPFRSVIPGIAVAPQIRPEDAARAASDGYTLIVNNRPDGEEPGQPTGAEIEAAAKAAGLAYVHVPVRGMPTAEQVDLVAAAVAAAEGPTLLFCRSGTRSIITWSLGEVAQGGDRADLAAKGAAAGYDLSGVMGV